MNANRMNRPIISERRGYRASEKNVKSCAIVRSIQTNV